jgi:glycosyltransferase involved in cell wall biosynthesis
VRILGIDPKLITVIYLAHDSSFRPVKSQLTISETLKRYHISQPYLLHVGTLNPRKNLQFLIQVFAEVSKRQPPLSLVMTGKFGWYYEGLFSLVKSYGLEKKVIFTGYVADQERQALYSGAKIFTFPSLYEGFGLPPLEAMACGAPVVASNVSSIPEVVGEAGITLAPTDLGGWSRAITEIIDRPSLYRRLSLQSLHQAKKFSWQKTARQTIAVYEQVAQLP